jgi:hypothetical protein
LKTYRIFLASILLLSLGLVSCQQDPKAAIAGKWKELNGDETIEFLRDGTVTIKGKDGNLSGSYSFPDKNHLKLELGGIGALAGPMVATYSIASNQLTLTAPDGDKSTYRKVD